MKINANAKINLSLEICGKRNDGYHLIDTVMHSVSLYDEVLIEKSSEITVKTDISGLDGKDNLAYKAAELFFADFQIDGGVKIEIKKNIPLSAGLGGGSADAAAVLVGLRQLYNPLITDESLEKTALKLGADVPFFIQGGCKRAQGIGEILTTIKPLHKGFILLCKGEEKTSTGEMYRILDSKEYGKCDTDAVIKAVEQNDLSGISQNIYNAFLEIWKNSFVKKAMLLESPLAVSLSGSGPTWFSFYETQADAVTAKNNLQSQNIECFIVTPSQSAIIFE
ncbi:MAG: 4-(cytidine 5'-diphospho)-2-C-methyl-D-erythritol kinase [Clostridia bacterium]|nr:4-(cytidine 5'-diphospho)-2-C-methyl-D-erythritol kinase [Clostridia bacterium]